jgi:hypothetical protein
MQAIENGAPATLPEYTAGTSAAAFAQLTTTLAAIKTGMNEGVYGGGTGNTGGPIDATA